MNPTESNLNPSGINMSTVPVGQTVEENGQRRTVVERTKKFFKLELGSDDAANFQNSNEKVSNFWALVKKYFDSGYG